MTSQVTSAFPWVLAALTGLVGFVVGVSGQPQTEVVYVPQPVKTVYTDRVVSIMGEVQAITKTIPKEQEPTAQPFSCVVGRWIDQN